jgi:hypothetical protein
MPVAADITAVFPNVTPTTLATKADSTDEALEEEIDASKVMIFPRSNTKLPLFLGYFINRP